MTIKVIILDFDGVIVESNNIKHRAFAELFKEYPAYYNQIMEYHLAHNHIDRHAKFKHIIENILKQKYDKELAQRWAKKFSDLTRNNIIACPYIPGAKAFLEYFSGKYPLYLASATPLDELEIILRSRGLLHYFKKIYGAPVPKKKMFENVVNIENINPENIMFIGDSPEDYIVASDFGCNFIAVADVNIINGAIRFNNMFEAKTWLAEMESVIR
ncbi:MAG: HAD hydrolase-like protein [Candidatus Margulisiibacteriota bacterium]